MNPIQNFIEKTIAFYEQMDDPRSIANYFALENWVNDNIPVAGETFREFVKKLYQRNELVQGEFHLGGRHVDLAPDHLSVLAADGQERSPRARRRRRKESAPHVAIPRREVDGDRRRPRRPGRRRQGAADVLAGGDALAAERSSDARRSARWRTARELRCAVRSEQWHERPPEWSAFMPPLTSRLKEELPWAFVSSGVGGYVPSKTVTNHELAMRVDTSHEWIAAKTGILERRIAAPDEAPSDMAARRPCAAWPARASTSRPST